MIENTIKLQTEINLEKKSILETKNEICSIGSCFSENFIKFLQQLKIPASSNPVGIIYNLHSILSALKRTIIQNYFTEKDFFQQNNVYKSCELHSDFSSENLSDAIKIANSSIHNFFQKLKQAQVIIITPSSSVVYELMAEKKIVANCHRIPGNLFKRKILSIEENRYLFQQIIEIIKKFNPQIKIIFSISPVRHYQGDLQLNSVSKANLRSSIEIVKNYSNCYYFPSYEIMLDELRDYRFYADDMLHPSETAKKIIFQKFITTYYKPEDWHSFSEKLKEAKLENHRIKK